MNTFAKIAAGALLAAAATGCYPKGFIYNGTTEPHPGTRSEVTGAAKTGDKAGEACATGILGLIAFGDASTDAAKKAAGVTDIHSEEFRYFSILGIYVEGCTEVHGK